MIITKPEVDPEGIYNIKQAIEALQISRTTFNKWMNNGYVKVRIRKTSGRPVVTGTEIIKCWKTMYL